MKSPGRQPAPEAAFNERVWRHALPALGYFGPTPSDCLGLALPSPVRELTLRLETDQPEFLNLRGIQFLKKGKTLALDQSGFHVEQTSVGGSAREFDPTALMGLRGCHTACERHPAWRVRFDVALDADQVRVLNRGDRWGSRSATLAVDIVDAESRHLTLYRGCGPEAVATAIAAAQAVAGPLPDAGLVGDGPSAEDWRREVVARVAAQLQSSPEALLHVAWRELIQLVDFWTPRVPSDDELVLIAGYLLHQREHQYASSLRSFSAVLGSRSSLDRLSAALAALARARGSEPLILTRHGLSPAGKLVCHVDAVLDHLQDVVSFLESRGKRPVIAYGTLLGAVRAGTFIPHDDDVDVLFRATATTREGVEAEMAALRQAFLDAGYLRVSAVRFSLNLHVFHPVTTMMVDVFPCWEEDGELKLHMESMKVRGIDPGIVHPRGSVRLHGRQLPAPGAAEEFLRERYGPEWARSDPYFEWPWPLSDGDA